MNQKKAKALRRMAKSELNLRPDELLIKDRIVTNRLGQRHRVEQVINEPHSARNMTLQLKKHYKLAAKAGKFKKTASLEEQLKAERGA